jgi:drug/metabolite transporter (DMT)-like permease
VPPIAFAFAFAAAFVHAGWNLLLGRAEDSEAATSAAMLVGVAVFAPVALASGHVVAAAWPFLVASNALELGYIALLARAYNEGRASAVYPIARGSAPVLVLVASIVLGRGADAPQLVGIVLVAGGVVLLRARGGSADDGGVSRAGLLLGLAVGTCIAGYTLVDKSGLEHASPLPYLELAMTGPAIGYFALVAHRSGVASVRNALDRSTVAAGVGLFGAYALVLFALARSAAAPVAAVRETSVVILTIMSALWLRETISRRQWLAAVVIVAGIGTLALG